jgi:hypothetical protein
MVCRASSLRLALSNLVYRVIPALPRPFHPFSSLSTFSTLSTLFTIFALSTIFTSLAPAQACLDSVTGKRFQEAEAEAVKKWKEARQTAVAIFTGPAAAAPATPQVLHNEID